MKVTVHQPNYLPYLGVFAKISASDVFVIYDTAQYEKGSVHNRQKIRTHQGDMWLTIPVKSSLTSFIDTQISYEVNNSLWFEKHFRALELNYKKTGFYTKYIDALHALYHQGHPHTLASFSIPIIRFFLDAFNLKQKVVLFSDLGIDPALSPSEKLAVAVEKLGGSEYISGPSGKHYLKLEPFKNRSIEVSFFEFQHPVYEQYHSKFDGKFMPNMAALDALLNIGRFPSGARLPQSSASLSQIQGHR